MIQLNNQRYWLYVAVDPETNEFLHIKTNEFLHIRLYPTRTTVATKQFLTELQEKHRVATRCLLSMAHRGYKPHFSRKTSDFGMSHTEIAIASNVSSKR